MTSLYNIAQQVQKHTNKGTWQEIITAVINAYATIAAKTYYEGKADGNSGLDNSFIGVFRNIPIQKEGSIYYCKSPATYLSLPHSFGVKEVTFTGSQTPFWMVGNYSMFIGGRSAKLGGNIAVEIEGERFTFPNMTGADIIDGNGTKTIQMKFACGLSTEDADDPLNIAPNIVAQIVTMVVQQYAPTPMPINENIK